MQHHRIIFGRNIGDLKADLAVPCKFDCIVGQVQDNLVNTDMVAQQHFRQIRSDIYDKFDILCSDAGSDGVDNIGD